MRTVYLWPGNAVTWRCWGDVQTQWRVGPSGAFGLDYAGVRAELDEQCLTQEERSEAWRGIKVCERAILAAWSEQREQDALQQELQKDQQELLGGLRR